MTPADYLLHVFSTFLGMPPDVNTPPVCGAELTREYDHYPGPPRPHCTECDRVLAEHNRRKGKA